MKKPRTFLPLLLFIFPLMAVYALSSPIPNDPPAPHAYDLYDAEESLVPAPPDDPIEALNFRLDRLEKEIGLLQDNFRDALERMSEMMEKESQDGLLQN